MADTPQDQADAAVQAEQVEKQRAKDARAAQQAAAKADVDEFPTERLIEEAFAWFGQPSQALAGGLALKKITKQNLTLAEAQKAIDAYLAHEPENQEV